MHNNKIYKLGIVLSIITFSFISFSSKSLAVNYGSGLYGSGLYSATIPSATATPTAGNYSESQIISLKTDGGNTIRYSTINTPANCSSETLYTTPIEISITTTIYTLACDIYGNSTPANFNYVISKSSSSGSTVLARYNYFLSIGNLEAALELKLQYPDIFKSLITESPSIPVIIETPILLVRTLKHKSIGEDVRQLQIFLNTHGYTVSINGYGSKGNETNYFGPKTKQAVIKFQIANNLIGDGIVGKLTREKIK